MSVQDYKNAYNKILFSCVSREVSYVMYVRLLNIFVQDCALDIHEKYFGNNTKIKGRILFQLQEYFERDIP